MFTLQLPPLGLALKLKLLPTQIDPNPLIDDGTGATYIIDVV